VTIERGQAWGEAAARPGRVVQAASDDELARLAAAALQAGLPLTAELTSAGDVLRTLGLAGPRPLEDQLRYRFDLGWASLDGDPPRPFVAHLCARRQLWAGPFAVAMNCAWRGSWYLGPRAHPNDGLLDITWGTLGLRQRLLARRRLPTGSHLPHPALNTERTGRWRHRFPAPVVVALDRCELGRYRELEVWLTPDCFSLFA
jgi:hypothetical protein